MYIICNQAFRGPGQYVVLYLLSFLFPEISPYTVGPLAGFRASSSHRSFRSTDISLTI